MFQVTIKSGEKLETLKLKDVSEADSILFKALQSYMWLIYGSIKALLNYNSVINTSFLSTQYPTLTSASLCGRHAVYDN